MPNTANTTTQDDLLSDLLSVHAKRDASNGSIQVVKATKGMYPYIAEVEARLNWADQLNLKTPEGLTPRASLDAWMAALTVEVKALKRVVSIKVAIKYWMALNTAANFMLDTDSGDDYNPEKGRQYKLLAESITKALKEATNNQLNCSHSPTKKDGYYFFPAEMRKLEDDEVEAVKPVWMQKAGL
jgi:hypothetical protein